MDRKRGDKNTESHCVMRKHIYFPLIGFLIVVIIASCSIRKHTLPSKLYQSVQLKQPNKRYKVLKHGYWENKMSYLVQNAPQEENIYVLKQKLPTPNKIQNRRIQLQLTSSLYNKLSEELIFSNSYHPYSNRINLKHHIFAKLKLNHFLYQERNVGKGVYYNKSTKNKSTSNIKSKKPSIGLSISGLASGILGAVSFLLSFLLPYGFNILFLILFMAFSIAGLILSIIALKKEGPAWTTFLEVLGLILCIVLSVITLLMIVFMFFASF